MSKQIEPLVKLPEHIQIRETRTYMFGALDPLVEELPKGGFKVVHPEIKTPERLGLIAACMLDAAEYLRQKQAAELEARVSEREHAGY